MPNAAFEQTELAIFQRFIKKVVNQLFLNDFFMYFVGDFENINN